MLGLLALGALDRSPAFQLNNVTEELINNMGLLNNTSFPFYPELVPALANIGRYDLVRAVQRKIALYKEPEWKTYLKKGFNVTLSEFDRMFFRNKLKNNHRISKIKKHIFSYLNI